MQKCIVSEFYPVLCCSKVVVFIIVVLLIIVDHLYTLMWLAGQTLLRTLIVLLDPSQFLRILFLLRLLIRHQIVLNRLHELIVFLHGFERLFHLLERDEVGESRTQLQEFLQVGMWFLTLSDLRFVQATVEIRSFHYL